MDMEAHRWSFSFPNTVSGDTAKPPCLAEPFANAGEPASEAGHPLCSRLDKHLPRSVGRVLRSCRRPCGVELPMQLIRIPARVCAGVPGVSAAAVDNFVMLQGTGDAIGDTLLVSIPGAHSVVSALGAHPP